MRFHAMFSSVKNLMPAASKNGLWTFRVDFSRTFHDTCKSNMPVLYMKLSIHPSQKKTNIKAIMPMYICGAQILI